MDVAIQIAEKDRARGWGLLVSHSPGRVLPGPIFIVSEEARDALRRAGIEFTELSKPSKPSVCQGVA